MDPCEEALGKLQAIRLWDVLLIGPLMVYGGVRARSLPAVARAGLVLFGLATVGFNGANWLRVRAGERSLLSEAAAGEAST